MDKKKKIYILGETYLTKIGVVGATLVPAVSHGHLPWGAFS